MKRLATAITVVAILAWVAASALPASAAPTDVQVSRVYQGPCDNPECDGSDESLEPGSIVRGTAQIHVSARSATGLSTVRLQGRRDVADAPWVCIRHWNTSAGTFSNFVNWNTNAWPSTPTGCPDATEHGAVTRNGAYELRVVATDVAGSTNSSAFAIRFDNKPQEPVWSDDPIVDDSDEANPIIELRWEANAEPDIAEYHYIRTDPSGRESEYAVSASKPGGQGCERDGSGYICYDDDFGSSGFGGSYSYALVALRSSPSGSNSCALSGANCVRSSSSEAVSADLNEPVEREPAPTPSTRNSPAAGGGSPSTGSTGSGTPTTKGSPRPTTVLGNRSSSYKDFFTGEYDTQLPYDERRVLVPGSKDGRSIYAAGSGLGTGLPVQDASDDRLWRSLAAGMLLMLGAAHMARMLRHAGG